MARVSKIVRLLAALTALGWLGLTLYLFARRVAYPYDLEWMEGGMLCHALRLLEGKPLYAPPSVDFIPFFYTPLYPALLAALSRVFGLGYAMARATSALSFLFSCWLGYTFARRHGGSRTAAATAMAIPLAAFVRTGTFHDLARPDSLWLALSTAGLLAIYRGARDSDGARRTDLRRHLVIAGAGVLLVLAFFTKQTAAPMMIAGGAALLLLDWRLVPTFGATLAAVGLPLLYACNRATDGWFWTYVFKGHQQHDFYPRRAFLETPLVLLAIVGPALVVVPWALWRRRSPALLYAVWIGAVGVAVSCLAFGTQWAYLNAYLPGVFFPSLAIGVAAGRLVKSTEGRVPRQTSFTASAELSRRAPRLRPAAIYALCAASLLLRVPDCLFVVPKQPLWLAHTDEGQIRPLVPAAADRAAGDRLVARLRAVEGEVLIPFHPFYAHLAGKRTYVHRMGVHDVARSGLGAPAGLAEAIRGHRFALAIFDNKIAGTWDHWPGFLAEYRAAPPSLGPPMVSGAVTSPELAYVPR
ncbi:MAG: hypothetical protein EXR72_13705 [Myxococcales bacterium]|nr:hypothetical protein [Myxococcales bacterium]